MTDLCERYERDLAPLGADWVAICIGINDVWRAYDVPEFRLEVPISRYEAELEGLVQRTLATAQRAFVMSPFFLEMNRSDPMRQHMDQFGAMARSVADRQQATFVDLQAAFDLYLEHANSYTLAGDRIHPNLTGHLIIARAFLQTSGLIAAEQMSD